MNPIWYDLDPLASELWVVAGPPGYAVEDIDPDALPEGFRWVTNDEWAEGLESDSPDVVQAGVLA